ncbi:MAG TPA: hypothetical protein PLH92_19110 [Mycobacterium sp.]|nr:hypothetical protein [Mycobacterium sp.]HQC78819.1 hypothetical protein [Mycobacterium sp.]
MFNPRIRQTAYGLGTIATTVVTILALWHGIDGGTATALGNAITAILGLLGVGATATAGVVVSKQRKEGALDFSGSPEQQAVDAINAVSAQAQAATAALDKVKAAASDVLSTIPVFGPLAKQVIDSVKLP